MSDQKLTEFREGALVARGAGDSVLVGNGGFDLGLDGNDPAVALVSRGGLKRVTALVDGESEDLVGGLGEGAQLNLCLEGNCEFPLMLEVRSERSTHQVDDALRLALGGLALLEVEETLAGVGRVSSGVLVSLLGAKVVGKLRVGDSGLIAQPEVVLLEAQLAVIRVKPGWRASSDQGGTHFMRPGAL